MGPPDLSVSDWGLFRGRLEIAAAAGQGSPRLESGAPAHHLTVAPSVLCREPSGRSSPTRHAFETFMSVLFVASAACACGALLLPFLFSLFRGRSL